MPRLRSAAAAAAYRSAAAAAAAASAAASRRRSVAVAGGGRRAGGRVHSIPGGARGLGVVGLVPAPTWKGWINPPAGSVVRGLLPPSPRWEGDRRLNATRAVCPSTPSKYR